MRINEDIEIRALTMTFKEQLEQLETTGSEANPWNTSLSSDGECTQKYKCSCNPVRDRSIHFLFIIHRHVSDGNLKKSLSSNFFEAILNKYPRLNGTIDTINNIGNVGEAK
ncbi:7453_t:CDS:2 [Rhizophagus irregularis]|nr:7453_t:CDS:2 [Rhizophagus irregularis]